MGNVITLVYTDGGGNPATIGFKSAENGQGTKLIVGDKELENFIIVDEAFTPILTMIEKSKQDIYVDTYAPLNQTPRANVYTKSEDEQIPIGTLSADATPSIDNIIIIFEDMVARGDMQTPEGPISQPRTYFNFKRLGQIITVDAR